MPVPVRVGAFTENLKVFLLRPVFAVQFVRCRKLFPAGYVNDFIQGDANIKKYEGTVLQGAMPAGVTLLYLEDENTARSRH